MNNEVYLGNLTLNMYNDVIEWCRKTFGSITIGIKWNLIDAWRLMLSDDFYTLFLLRWA